MTRGRGTASIVASPVLVGAVTTLVVIVSVFLAYNANQGLPFVPTYDLNAQIPSGANLVKSNEVRVGGFRVEFDDFLSTFDAKTQQNSQDALTGFGDALAGRGSDLNEAIANLGPFFRYLEPVMHNLSAPDTHLDEFFKQIGRASAQVAPVARQQAEVFKNQADTFDALIHNQPQDLQQTIEKSPPSEQTAIESFRVQRPF